MPDRMSINRFLHTYDANNPHDRFDVNSRSITVYDEDGSTLQINPVYSTTAGTWCWHFEQIDKDRDKHITHLNNCLKANPQHIIPGLESLG